MNTQISDNQNEAVAIEKDIVETRNRMDGTINRLAAKADPSDLVDSIYQWGRRKIDNMDSQGSADSLKNVASEAGRLVKENPVPVALGLAAIGSTFLPSSEESDGSSSDGKLASLKNTASEKLDSFKELTADKTSEIKEAIGSKTGSLQEKVGDGTSHLREKAEGHLQNASAQLSEAKGRTSGHTSALGDRIATRFETTKNENPLSLCAGVLVSGFVLGLLLPKSRQEEKLYGSAAHVAKAKLVEKSRTMADEAKARISEKRQHLVNRTEEAIDQYGNRIEEKIEQS